MTKPEVASSQRVVAYEDCGLTIGYTEMAPNLKPQRFRYIPSSEPLRTTRFVYIPSPPQADVPTADLEKKRLCLELVDLINQTRRQAGLRTVAWDKIATQAGQLHTEDMAIHHYFSHWNLQDYGPDVRFSLAGGTDMVMENLYMCRYRYTNDRVAPISNWSQVIREAHDSLMRSKGHRANILDPAHTHVGIGLTYDPQAGSVYIAEEFLNRYVELIPLPQVSQLGTRLTFQGTLFPQTTSPLINLAHEPIPQPISVYDVTHNRPRAYRSAAEFFEAPPCMVNGQQFSANFILDHHGRAGLYHIRIWVDVAREPILTSNVIIKVE